MPDQRKLSNLPLGEGTACVYYLQKVPGSNVERFAEQRPVKVTDKQVIVYLDDNGDKVVKFDRRRNTTARVYLEMTLEETVRERVVNHLRNSTSCCYAGEREPISIGPCKLHTPAWIAAETKRTVATIRAATEITKI